MLQVVVISGSEISNHRPVVAGNHHTAASSGFFGINAVFDSQTGRLNGVAENGGVLVISYSSQVNDGIGGK